VVHRNAPLSETGRLRLARCVVGEQWPLRRAAERFQVSVTAAARWAGRYRALGDAGMAIAAHGRVAAQVRRRHARNGASSKSVWCAVGGQRESATCWGCTPLRCIGC
jgi:hypothetical protein